MPSTLPSLSSRIPDPRRGQGQVYPQAPILPFAVLAMLAGAVSHRQVHAFIRIHLARLDGVFGVSVRKAPAYSTVRFILRGLDGVELERVFRQHAAGLPTPPAQERDDAMPDEAMPACVAIDGKTLRGSFDALDDRKAAHLPGAFASDGQVILGHLAIDGKSNEIPAAQDLIAALGLAGHLFTLDAMHAQENIRRSPGHGEPPAGSTQGEPAQPR